MLLAFVLSTFGNRQYPHWFSEWYTAETARIGSVSYQWAADIEDIVSKFLSYLLVEYSLG